MNDSQRQQQQQQQRRLQKPFEAAGLTCLDMDLGIGAFICLFADGCIPSECRISLKPNFH